MKYILLIISTLIMSCSTTHMPTQDKYTRTLVKYNNSLDELIYKVSIVTKITNDSVVKAGEYMKHKRRLIKSMGRTVSLARKLMKMNPEKDRNEIITSILDVKKKLKSIKRKDYAKYRKYKTFPEEQN